MALTYRVDIDGAAGGPWMGHRLDEIGCIWLAPTAEAALDLAPEAMAAFNDWLGHHGEPGVAAGTAPDPQQVEAGLVQEVVDFGQSGAAVGLFPWDLAPATADDIRTAVRRLGYARRDVLELVAGLPPQALDWQPPENRRTIRQNLIHVRNAQGFYLTRVFGWDVAATVLPDPWPDESLSASLAWVTTRMVNALVEMPEELRSGTFQAEQPHETWTARKMLRRIVEHEREHLEVMRRTARAFAGERVDTRPWM